MKCCDILNSYKRGDLNRLAKNKIANYAGLPIEILRDELSKALTTYDYVKRNIQFRKPPGYTILDIIVHQNKCSIPIQMIKSLVQKEIGNVIEEAKSGDGLKEDKQYDLYGKMLKTAWDYQEDLLPPEANLLTALREHLDITLAEHRLLEARLPNFKFSENSFKREIEHFANAGIIFTYGPSYIVPEEIVERIKEVWGIELDPAVYQRLLDYLTTSQLSSALARLDLTKSGSKEAKIKRILDKGIDPSNLLGSLTVNDLTILARNAKCPQKPKKDELIPTIVSHIKRGEDIKPPEPVPSPEFKPEPRVVTDEALKEALSRLRDSQLAEILAKKKLRISGTKKDKIERLANSRYSFETILNSLNVGELINLCRSYDLTAGGRKSEIVGRITEHFQDYQIKRSTATPKELFSIYDDLSKQNKNAYRDIGIDDSNISMPTVTADFERATRYIFESIFRLTVKPQTPGREEPDGIIKEDKIILYDCKTVLSPPYELPISHRDQFSRYIKNQYDKLEKKKKTALKSFIIIAHSFADRIENKIKQMKVEPYIPFCLVTARDLKLIAEKWLEEQKGKTLPTSALIFQGRYTLSEFKKKLI